VVVLADDDVVVHRDAERLCDVMIACVIPMRAWGRRTAPPQPIEFLSIAIARRADWRQRNPPFPTGTATTLSVTTRATIVRF